MSRTVVSVLTLACLLGWAGVFASPPEKEAAHPNVKDAVKGVYSIFQMDREIGIERFSKTVYDNNRMTLESRSVFTIAEPDSFIEATSMTLEDDSYFFLDYASSRIAGKLDHRTEIEMFSNVASITTTTGGKSNSITRTVSTGALLIQSGVVHHLELYLLRYNHEVGGKQSISVFDPIGKSEYTKIVEMAGTEETAVRDETRLLKLYTVQGEKGLEMKLYVDESNRIVKAENPLQRMIYQLLPNE
jgi:hypothetical protein